MEENNTYYQQPNNAYVNPEHTLKQSKQEQTLEKNILSEKNKHELEIIDKNNYHNLVITSLTSSQDYIKEMCDVLSYVCSTVDLKWQMRF